jgi:hypothetical protein
MKLFSLFILFGSLSYAQVSLEPQVILDFNNVSAAINNTGGFFLNADTYDAGYEIPKGSGNRCVYTASFWYGGLESTSQELRMSLQTYQPNEDIFPGPYSSSSAYLNSDYVDKYGVSIWSVLATDIESHILNYSDPSYIIPNAILDWPGNGDMTLGVSEQLAPFVDLNSNEIYEPELGDYPSIKGCSATYLIFNDVANTHGSGAPEIGIEVHQMFYQLSATDTENDLNGTTFIEQRIINKSSYDFADFYTTFFMDTDIGNWSDDFSGCDSSRNMMFSYNGDDFDNQSSSAPGYGEITPSLGVVLLNGNLSGAGQFNATSFTPANFPYTLEQYYNYMQGFWSDGSSMIYGGNGLTETPAFTDVPTKFLYSGNPSNTNDWSEVSMSNTPGDRRIYMNVKDTLFEAGEVLEYHYSVIHTLEGVSGQGIDYLNIVADSVQSYYDNLDFDCGLQTVSIDAFDINDFICYPNPSTGFFTVEFKNIESGSVFEVLDLNGRTILRKDIGQMNSYDFVLEDSPGIYIAVLRSNDGLYTKRIVIE